MRRKCPLALSACEQHEQAGQMRKMTRDEDVACFSTKPVGYPIWRIVGLEVPSGRKLGQRVARTPERFGSLFCAQLAAVPHDGRLHAPCSRFGCKTHHVRLPVRRQRALRIDFRTDGVAVMN
jgi:hypothetical protein